MQAPVIQSPSIRPQDLILVVSIILIGCIVYFAAIPQAKSLKANMLTLQQKREELAKLKRRADDLNRLQDRIAQIKEDIDRLGVAYPEKDQTIEALIQAQIIASSSAMAVERMTPSTAKDGFVPVSMSVSGRFVDLSGFLRGLNNNLRPILVKSVTIAAAGDNERPLVAVNTLLDFAYAGTLPVSDVAGGPPLLPAGGLDAPPVNEPKTQ